MTSSNNEEFIKKNKVVLVDDDKNTRLHYACALNNLEVVQTEIKNGQKIDPENYLGWTPLMMAIRNGNMAIVQYLLEHRADATKINKFGISVFLLSVTSGDLEMCKMILEHLFCGGISRQVMQQVLSPISLSIMFGQSHIFKYLIERSFDLNAATPVTLITPLMFAAAMGNNKAIKKLVNLRVNTKAKNYLGYTAPDITTLRNSNFITLEDLAKHKQAKAAAAQTAAVAAEPPAPASAVVVAAPAAEAKKAKPQLPLLMVSHPDASSPCVQISPFANLTSMTSDGRNSSNLTPLFCSPAITPITPQIVQQMFFPQDFVPQHYFSPAAYTANDALNARMLHTPYFSPVPQQQPIIYTNYSLTN